MKGARSLAVGIVLVAIPITMARAMGYDEVTPLAQLMAYSSYVGWLALAALVFALITRAGPLILLALVVAGVHVWWQVPRFIGEDFLVPAAYSAPPADAPRLRVMTLNMHVGEADAATIVRLVREQRVDVLALQELTPQAVNRLNGAGIASLLPHNFSRPAPGPGGMGIYSLHPLSQGRILPGTTFPMTGARIQIGRQPVTIQAVHVTPPMPGSADRWARDLEALGAVPASGPRVLLGDFNATLDHARIRRLTDAGYLDLHEALGRGAVRTWPATSWFPPPVAIDHVFVNGGMRPVGVMEQVVPGADHRAVIGEVAITG